MKRSLYILALSLVSALTAAAQANSVSTELVLEQSQFLANEELRVAVRVTNFSGRTLHLGGEPGWLTFIVESREHVLVEKRDNPPVAGEFKLESSMTATKRVDLCPYFDVQKPGRYKVTARVRIPGWDSEILSEPKHFDIVRGTVLKEIEFGVPTDSSFGQRSPEVRKYVLQQADYQKEMRLYVRVTDATGARTIKLLPLARMLSFSRPEAQLDRFGNLHILHQSGQRSFSYCCVNPAGQLMSRQTHDFSNNSRPRLLMDDQGKISVRGGTRRATENDLPPHEDFDPPLKTNADQP